MTRVRVVGRSALGADRRGGRAGRRVVVVRRVVVAAEAAARAWVPETGESCVSVVWRRSCVWPPAGRSLGWRSPNHRCRFSVTALCVRRGRTILVSIIGSPRPAHLIAVPGRAGRVGAGVRGRAARARRGATRPDSGSENRRALFSLSLRVHAPGERRQSPAESTGLPCTRTHLHDGVCVVSRRRWCQASKRGRGREVFSVECKYLGATPLPFLPHTPHTGTVDSTPPPVHHHKLSPPFPHAQPYLS